MKRPLSIALVTVATLALAAPAASPAAAYAAPPKPVDEIRLIATHTSLLGTHYWYEQRHAGVVVLGGYYAKHVDRATGAVTIDDGRKPVSALPTTVAALTTGTAGDTATRRAGGKAYNTRLVVVPGANSRLAFQVLTDPGKGGPVATVVDAGSGSVLSSAPIVKDLDKPDVTGKGRVFGPNPSVTLQNGTLDDAADKDLPIFAAAYKNVDLDHLDNSGYLRGPYAHNTSSVTAHDAGNNFLYNRHDRQFEQVMGYYHITSAQEYIQSLGFTDVNNSPQNYRTTSSSDDNSFYDPSIDKITFGTGGVDDAEDAEVIWHEYGHAIQDAQVPGFGETEEAGSIGEGFGDYWAYTMSEPVSVDSAVTPLACIADWDSVSYTDGPIHCLRRVDGPKVYPGNVEGEVHADGEMWSRALFDIHAALGREKSDKVILEAHFMLTPDTTFAFAATRTVATARALYGAAAGDAVQAAFHARGFL